MVAVSATGIFGALGVAALATAVPALWRWTQLFSTFVHESGHAFVNLLIGRVVVAVEIFLKGGGCTTSVGKSGPLQILSTAAGYAAPPLVGLALVAALVHGASVSTLLLIALLLVVVILVLSRNVGAVVVVGTVIAALAILIHRAGPISQTIAVLIAAWFLLLAGLRNNIELVCIDVANGYTETFLDFVKRFREAYPGITIMAGNVFFVIIPGQKLLVAAKRSGQPVDITVYPGAHHSFDSRTKKVFNEKRRNGNAKGGLGATTEGNAEAWADAVTKVEAFLGQHLGAKK